jgi:hypothetical protein
MAAAATEDRWRMIPRMTFPRRRPGLQSLITATIVAVLTLPAQVAAEAQVKQADGCVTIGTPKSSHGFSYRQTQSSGGMSEFTDWWEQFTRTGSRLLTTPGRTKGPGILTVNQHRIVNDVLVLDSSSQSGPGAGGISSYKPGVVSAPVRACQGRSWPVPAVKVTSRQAQGTFSAMSDEGTLKIVAIHEAITVPAGRFDTVHWVRNLRSKTGMQLNEYWTSTEHGVVVKRVHTIGGVVITATLQAIK